MGKCKDCEWWDENAQVIEDVDFGLCRKNPPICLRAKVHCGANHSSENCGAWPITGAGDWCGEFVRRGTDGESGMTPPAVKEKCL